MSTTLSNNSVEPISSFDLTLVIAEPNVLAYLSGFEDEELRAEKALEALKVGVIAIQSASPTLDMRVVQAKFDDLESRLTDYMDGFRTSVTDQFGTYFKDGDGVIPRSLTGTFGKDGVLSRTFQSYFDPNDGKLSHLMQLHIGPQSPFGKSLDPRNKDGILTLIEAKVQELVEAKLDEVVKEFSLDEDGTAMFRLKGMLTDLFNQLNQSLGIKAGAAQQAALGHVKGIEFESDVYQVFAEIGRQLGDETDFVRGVAGVLGRSKKGDFVATLGETSGAPGRRIAFEVKNQPQKLKEAIDELQDAKKNREAACGIFIYARGTEPAEVGDFRRIGEDFYVTVDKDDLLAGRPLMFLDAAYKIARALTVAGIRQEESGEVQWQAIQDQIDALAAWSERISDMAIKASTIQKSGKLIEQCANDLKKDLDERVERVLNILKRASAA